MAVVFNETSSYIFLCSLASQSLNSKIRRWNPRACTKNDIFVTLNLSVSPCVFLGITFGKIIMCEKDLREPLKFEVALPFSITIILPHNMLAKFLSSPSASATQQTYKFMRVWFGERSSLILSYVLRFGWNHTFSLSTIEILICFAVFMDSSGKISIQKHTHKKFLSS